MYIQLEAGPSPESNLMFDLNALPQAILPHICFVFVLSGIEREAFSKSKKRTRKEK